MGDGVREGGTCKKETALEHYVSTQNLELTCFTVLDFRLAISANDHHAILSPPTWKGNEMKNYGLAATSNSFESRMQVPYRDNPLPVAAEVQVGGARGWQPQRGVELGACAEVPHLRRIAL